MDRLLREMRLIEEQRRSLDRRRDQTRLLTRQGGGAEPSNRTQPSVVSTPQEA